MKKTEIKALESEYKKYYIKYCLAEKGQEEERCLNQYIGFSRALEFLLKMNGIDAEARCIKLNEEAKNDWEWEGIC